MLVQKYIVMRSVLVGNLVQNIKEAGPFDRPIDAENWIDGFEKRGYDGAFVLPITVKQEC